MAAEILRSGNVPSLVSNIEVMTLLQEKYDERQEKEALEEELNHGDVGADDDDDDEEKRQQRFQKREIQNQLRHRDWIEDKVFTYLQATPCVETDITQLPELIRTLKRPHRRRRGTPDRNEENLITSSNDGTTTTDEEEKKDSDASPSAGESNTAPSKTGYGLTDSEALQIINVMPKEPVDLHLVVQHVTERFTEQEQNDLLEIIQSYRITSADEPEEEVTPGGEFDNHEHGEQVQGGGEEEFMIED